MALVPLHLTIGISPFRQTKRPGFTLLEVMVAAGIFSLVFLGGYAMLATASHSFDRNSAQTHADVDAVLAMQHIIGDLREAKSFTIVNGGPQGRIVISYPVQLDTDGDGQPDAFDRFFTDPNPDNQVTYYVQNRTLWRLRPSEHPDPMPVRWGVNDEGGADVNESGIEALHFASDSPLSVKVTVRTSFRRKIPTPDPETGAPIRVAKTTELTQRLVYLRNW